MPQPDLIGRYLAELAARGATPGTIRAYTIDCRYWAHFCNVGGHSVDQPTDEAVADYIRRTRERYAAATAIRRASSLRCLFRFGVEAGLADHIPRIPRAIRRRAKIPRVLSREEIEAMASSGPATWLGARRRALVEMLYSTMARISELRALDTGDIDLHTHTVIVHGKGDKERIVPVGEPAALALRLYLEFEGRPRCANPMHRNALFVSIWGRRVGVDTIRRDIRKAARDAGITRRVWPHLERHSGATHMLENGANLMAIKLVLGHENIRSTEVYTHMSPQNVIDSFLAYHPRARIEPNVSPTT